MGEWHCGIAETQPTAVFSKYADSPLTKIG